jgi:hypothetical protein
VCTGTLVQYEATLREHALGPTPAGVQRGGLLRRQAPPLILHGQGQRSNRMSIRVIIELKRTLPTHL